MQNDQGEIIDSYIPRICSASNRIIGSKDHTSIQMQFVEVNEDGRVPEVFKCELQDREIPALRALVSDCDDVCEELLHKRIDEKSAAAAASMPFQPNLGWLASLQRATLNSMPQSKVVPTTCYRVEQPPPPRLAASSENDSDKENFGQDDCDDFELDNEVGKRPAAEEMFDELPVSGCNKSFHELLDEELRRSVVSKEKFVVKSATSLRRPFLKRGQGLQRFRGASTAQPIAPQSQVYLKASSKNQRCNPVLATSTEPRGSLQPTRNPRIKSARNERRLLSSDNEEDEEERNLSLHDTVEEAELEEFELLEQAVDDSVCNLDELQRHCRKSLQNRVEEKRASRMSKCSLENIPAGYMQRCDAKSEEISASSPLGMRRKIAQTKQTGLDTGFNSVEFNDDVRWLESAPISSTTSLPDSPQPQTILNDVIQIAASSTRGNAYCSTRPLSDTSDSVKASLLREKLHELEMEISRFRSENASLLRLRKEQEACVSELKHERAELAKERAQAAKDIEEERSRESAKLRKEKRLFDEYQRAMKSLGSKEEREEVQKLREELAKTQAETAAKEARWSATNQRLRQRVDVLEKEAEELHQQVRKLEEAQLQLKSIAQQNNLISNDVVSKQAPDLKTVYRPADRVQHLLQTALLANPSAVSKVEKNKRSREDKSSTASNKNKTKKEEGGHKVSGAMVALPQPPFSDSLPEAIGEIVEEIRHTDGRLERLFATGAREIHFPNGTRKQESRDGTALFLLFNGDLKRVMANGRVEYYYAESGTTHVTSADGSEEILFFADGKTERLHSTGTKEIRFPDGVIKCHYPDGREESIFPNGTVVCLRPASVTGEGKEKEITFPNGQRELHTRHFRRREYPDGTCKTVWPDGRQETRYANGRLRVKDASGNLVVDKMMFEGVAPLSR